MINEIKIYKGDGSLKEIVTQDKAIEMYNEQNKEEWTLSPSERHWWKGLKLDDPLPRVSKHDPRWMPKKYKKQIPTYKVKCIICDKETMKASKDAKYCGSYCYGVNRRKIANKNYSNRRKPGEGFA